MVYKGVISDINDSVKGGFFKTPFINETGDREWFVSTHNWATGIRRTFPCWDEPEIKATFKIIVLQVRNYYEKYTVLSNTHYRKRVRDTYDSIVETHFEKTSEIPTYLVAIVLCNFSASLHMNIFEKFGGSRPFKMNVDLRCREKILNKLIFASHVIANVTHYFQDEWKQLIVFPTQEHIAVPGLIDDGMAKWGLTFYRDKDIIYDEMRDNIVRKMEIASIIGREIARQLLNSKTSPSWWSHFWLNEGIATVLFTSKIIDKIIPNSQMSDLFVVQILQESLYLDEQGIMESLTSWEQKGNTISDINSIFSFSYYIKAPAILRMLQHIVGDQVFWNGIEKYLKKQSATPSDFWAVYESSDEALRFIVPKINITEIMYPWISQNHYPVLNVACNYNNESYFVIRMKNASETWQIPLTFTMRSYINFYYTLPVIVTLKNKIPMPMLSKDDWIILNLQQIGYYRVNYDAENWRRIACYLNSENYKNIHVVNRAQIIDDAFYFTMTKQLDASIFWKLTRYLSRETEYVAWYPMIKVLERISHIFQFPDESKYVKTIILGQLKPLLQTIKYNEDRNDSYLMECLRQEAVKWACVLNDSSCKTIALNKLRQHFTDIPHQFSSGWKKWTYCNGLSIADKTVLMKVHRMYMIETILFRNERKNLELLACSKHFYINSIIMKSEDYEEYYFRTIRENRIDNIKFFHYNVAKHARDNLVLNHILRNWERAKPKDISVTTALIDIINHVYSKEQLDRIKKFLLMYVQRWLMLEFKFTTNLKYLNSKLFSKIFECARDEVNKLILDIIKKIKLRLSQIKNQRNTLVSMFGISSAGQKMENCNA
ncbi:thyrotropin-releasing hormone-degrading ectoenzyme-like [Temnothorax curvispinosus]|uniref:Aminopeptidase n=1 Tax=Temnothorax curvispinosus TaxID=300111 RepID=A0A6J1QW81_9HYME|nr:thyrotropin-releasing hormone-degrading ectoenzyme-like [Temnothorax curvispinosus]